MSAKPRSYTAGEEVVVRLVRAQVFDPRRGAVLDQMRRPPWTIARVLHAVTDAEKHSYVLAFKHHGSDYYCAVDVSAIEGTA